MAERRAALHVIVTTEWLTAFKAKCASHGMSMREFTVEACDTYTPITRADLQRQVDELAAEVARLKGGEK